MRLCVLGGHGKTGRRVVELARLLGHDVKVLEGDALDAAALSHAMHGAQAVISLLGPSKHSVPQFCTKATEQVIEVMHEEGLSRLVMVTGAMCGPPEELGVFYRTMTHLPGLHGALEDRHEQEAQVMASTLAWTLVRPPRLSDVDPVSEPLVSAHGPVHMMESCARVHLAQALVRFATSSDFMRSGVYVHTESAKAAFAPHVMLSEQA